jgi:hypothetical protein
MNDTIYLKDPDRISRMCVNGGSMQETNENVTIFSYNGGRVIVGNDYLAQISPKSDENTIENLTGIKFGIKSDNNGNNDGSYSSKVSQTEEEKKRYYKKNPFAI